MEKLSPAWISAIEAEWQTLQTEETLHNRALHDRIVGTWKQSSPTFWRKLQQAGIGAKLAFVLQERMWQEQASLIKSGMPVTDAREQAEKAHLMLEPEAELAAA